MEKMRDFVVKRLHFPNFFDLHFEYEKMFGLVGLGLSFKKSGLDLDREIPLNSDARLYIEQACSRRRI